MKKRKIIISSFIIFLTILSIVVIVFYKNSLDKKRREEEVCNKVILYLTKEDPYSDKIVEEVHVSYDKKYKLYTAIIKFENSDKKSTLILSEDDIK